MAVDVRKWLTENMNALALSDEDKAAAEKLLAGNFGQRLGASIYPQEAVSGLQSELDKRQSALREMEDANVAWQNLYMKDVSELGGIDRLEAAGFDVSGLRSAANGGVQNAGGQMLSAAQIDALIDKKAREIAEPIRQTNLDYADFVVSVAPEYRELTGQRFDSKKFREFAFEHRKDYQTLQQAYDAYTAEPRKAKEDADRKKWEADKEKEIELRVMSRMQIPEAAFMGEGTGGSGGPFERARTASTPASGTPATPPAGSTSTSPAGADRDSQRQDFAKKYRDIDFTGL